MFSRVDVKLKRPVTVAEHRGDYINTYGYISYYKINKLYTLLSPAILALAPDTVTWTEVAPEANLPHRDHGVSTNLNIYIEPGGAATKFYNINSGAIPYTPDPERFYPNLYRPDDLKFYGEFTAQPQEAYLLDVTQVHQVSGLAGSSRTIIQLSWKKHSYLDLLDRFNQI